MPWNWKCLISVISCCVLFCDGENDCPECIEFSCDSIKCSSGQHCVLKSVTCVEEPCPKLPECIEEPLACNGMPPLTDEEGKITNCEDCPKTYECIQDVCCPETELLVPEPPDPETSNGITITGIDGDIPAKFLPDLFGEKKDGPDVCKPCSFSPCSQATCPKHMDALCVQENCSCTFWFVDGKGRNVECFTSDGPVIPFAPGVDLGETTVSSSPVSPAARPGFQEEKDKAGDEWKYGIIAACAIVVLGMILFIAYRVISIRHKSQSQEPSTKDIEEQKVPLKQVESSTTDNNNDVKLSGRSRDDDKNETTASSSTSALEG